MRKICLVLLAILLAAPGWAGEGKWRIALSNDYAGNSMRQSMIAIWKQAAAEAAAKGWIAEAPVFNTSESSAAEQSAQIQSLILEGYDAIALNAASPTALNAVVKEAIDAGVVVVSFDNNVTEPGAYILSTEWRQMSREQIDYLTKVRGITGGNLLEIRGLPGTWVDEEFHIGFLDSLKPYPNLRIVGSVYGAWTGSIAQKEVAGIIPSLPADIVAVITQGGDGFGAAKAFEASGRSIPLIMMGNRYDELEIWRELRDKSGYDTMSVSTSPGVSAIAFWTALEILEGTEVPKSMPVPPYVITKTNLEAAFASTEKGGVAALVYPRSWVQGLIANTKAGKRPPADP
ncbi:MAG: substrate-binding domain-containing protein [Planctomycetota bacterium]|jgi:ribose transport system substrate-binding protein|nr:substrate-binding domain-containing protein [Planctomycetota bacterium]